MFKVGDSVYLARDIGDDYEEGTEAFVEQVKIDEIILSIYDEEKKEENEISVGYTDILKSCPSCGCMPELIIKTDKYAKLSCRVCNAISVKMDVSVYYTALEEVIKFWNARA